MESIFSKLDLHKPQLLDTSLCSLLAYMVTLNSTMEATLDRFSLGMKCERIDLFLRDSTSTPRILLSPPQATVQLVRKKKSPA